MHSEFVVLVRMLLLVLLILWLPRGEGCPAPQNSGLPGGATPANETELSQASLLQVGKHASITLPDLVEPVAKHKNQQPMGVPPPAACVGQLNSLARPPPFARAQTPAQPHQHAQRVQGT